MNPCVAYCKIHFNRDYTPECDTKLHKSRLDRRKYKDLMEETVDIVEFVSDSSHKKTFDKMKQLLGKVRKAESYHENRVYIRRIEE